MKEYKYAGDIATGICENGHFTVAPFNACKQCGKQQFELKLLTKTLRLPAVLFGFRDWNEAHGYKALIRINGESEYSYSEAGMSKEFVILGVIDQNLAMSRLYNWEIITGK